MGWGKQHAYDKTKRVTKSASEPDSAVAGNVLAIHVFVSKYRVLRA
jgi:hypothetical protein